ncbi:CBS domain-containing protein [Guyparkeria hydrothermalis]|uniref:CBS domain-containing protein n=1 Tax=Guyparkeria hydrothermalis TaxID=923 RepID=UPI0020225928|nr:CBS domain-containing protein [Guyparkeria hydrothermalis]MCL7745375.1 CBS domain-containing protein [Guyparkeria hydrothermalis]
MSFTVFGRGVSDPVTIDEATSPGLLRPPMMVEPVRAVREDRGGTSFQRGARGGAGAERLRAYYEASGAVNREPAPVSLAEQIMSKPPITIGINDTVGRARDLMADRGIGLLPVMGDDGRIEAIITRGDITRQRIRYTDLAKMPVGAISRFEVLTAGPKTNIRELARVLIDQDIRGMPIVDQGEDPPRVIGVVTRSDILRALINYAPLELWL